MKLRLLSIALMLVLLTTLTTFAAKTKKEAAPKSDKPMKGQVVSLAKMMKGEAGTLSKADAKAEAEKGNPIVFLCDKKVYFVYNADGTFASTKLAGFANNKAIGIKGKKSTVNGVNYIMADMIESMD